MSDEEKLQDEPKQPDIQEPIFQEPIFQESEFPAPELPELQLEEDDLVIFGEDGRFYYVKKSDYTDPACRLPDKYRATPEFLVGLGTVVADITVLDAVQSDGAKPVQETPLTVRCSCVVLNVAAIRRESEKKKDKKEPHPIKEPFPIVAGAKSTLGKGELAPQPEDLVIFGEDEDFHLVKRDVYVTQELPPALKSAPLLMVELGTVVADIPRLPTAGSACELLNLASLRKGRTELASLIRDQKLDQRIAAKEQTLAILREDQDARVIKIQRRPIGPDAQPDAQEAQALQRPDVRGEKLQTRIEELEEEVRTLEASKSKPPQA
jgi:hypothetical protein